MICNKNKCTGCFACYNICPKNCILMKENEIGYIYPEIDENKCINCGACKKVCPQIHDTKMKKIQKAYAMYNKDEEIRRNSTSGGAATTFYMHILEKNGVVYGCSNIENNEVHFLRIDNINDLEQLKGSKYVHSYINDTFKLVKKDLLDDRLVLFIGTPCQIDGLKNFLNKDYKKLILIDIICHGVPSQKLLREEIKSHNIEGITKISFRGNDGYKLKLYRGNNNVLEDDIDENSYYFGFMNSVFCRPNCYECKYAKPSRISDITIGDFWGLSEDSKLYSEKDKGISVLLPITEKGYNIIDECRQQIILEERPVEEAINGNMQLRKPSTKPKKNKIFENKYLKKGYVKACNTFMWKNKLKKKLKRNKIVYKIYKKIKEKIDE